jgi:hypothetical protein
MTDSGVRALNDRLTEAQLAHLHTVGVAIDDGQRPTVFDGGVVGFNRVNESEVSSDVSGKETGSKSGPRSGRRAWARGAPAAHHPFRSKAVEAAYGARFRLLAQHYESLAFEDQNGLWAVVSSNPLGDHGPQVQFLIALPLDERLAPRAWAFEKIGPDARLASPKHTNFPDNSVCAFVPEDEAWPNPAGLVGLVDIYTLWVIRSWHRNRFGWWPGPQFGACSLYRLKEFDPREDCGCGSNKRYGGCHMAADLLANQEAASAEFRRLFGCDYGDRRPPQKVMEAARIRWRQMPSMAEVFAHRPDPSGVFML